MSDARSTPEPAAYALAYTEARRALDEQSKVLSELHTRAGTLIAAAAVTTSFLGSRILDGNHLSALAWVAVACFALVGVILIALLVPWRDWTFTVNAERFIQDYLEPPAGDRPPASLLEIHRNLALHMESSWQENRGQLRLLQIAFRVAAGALVVEVVLWVVALASMH